MIYYLYAHLSKGLGFSLGDAALMIADMGQQTDCSIL